ncbi:MAG: hypothetical protein Q7J05_04985 [Paludibacter sp.]|nr:hypothetical protein [Paludibacter sp.]
MVTTFIYFFSAVNIIIAFMIVSYNWRVNKNVIYLAVFLILFALESALLSTFNFGGNIDFYTYLFIISPLFFIKAPALYFFVRGIAHNQFYFNKKDLLHFIPVLIHLVAFIPYMLLSYEEKYSISEYILQNFEHLRGLNINTFYPVTWNHTTRVIQLFVYLIVCFYALRKVRVKFGLLKGQLKFQHNYTNVRLRILLTMIFIISALLLVLNYMFSMSYEKTELINYMHMMVNVVRGLYIAIPLLIIFSPKLLYGLPHLETKHISANRFHEADPLPKSRPIQTSDKGKEKPIEDQKEPAEN